MALWTPYAQESALDLSKTRVKSERKSPDLPVTNSSPPASGFLYHDYQPYYVNYSPVRPVHAVPSVSPESTGSWTQYPLPPSIGNSRSPPPGSPEFYEMDSLTDDYEYQEFERDAFRAMAEKNGGSLLGNNPRMRRAVQTNQTADDTYRKQRERNNFAAKQSRDRRKMREVRLAFQVTYLKKKMTEMKARLAADMCSKCVQTRDR